MEVDMGSIMDTIAAGCLPLVVRAAIELNVFDILAKAGPKATMSSSEIVSQLPTTNPNAAMTLDRILQLLASYSILSSTSGPNGERRYGLTPISEELVHSQDGNSLASLFLIGQSKVWRDGWYYLKDAVLEGCSSFSKAHGMSSFEYLSKDSKLSKQFNESMFIVSTNLMRVVLENYRGFDGLKEIVDVGGGTGISLKMIISKYPDIKGINFDLPYVVANAPPYPGMKHVGGDMFENVPSGAAIFMKSLLHDWDDERCLKILKNCWKSLPESGKVILVEFSLPSDAETDPISRIIVRTDVEMLAVNEGGRERTFKEYEALAKESGFAVIKAFPLPNGASVIECYKNS